MPTVNNTLLHSYKFEGMSSVKCFHHNKIKNKRRNQAEIGIQGRYWKKKTFTEIQKCILHPLNRNRMLWEKKGGEYSENKLNAVVEWKTQ